MRSICPVRSKRQKHSNDIETVTARSIARASKNAKGKYPIMKENVWPAPSAPGTFRNDDGKVDNEMGLWRWNGNIKNRFWSRTRDTRKASDAAYIAGHSDYHSDYYSSHREELTAKRKVSEAVYTAKNGPRVSRGDRFEAYAKILR